MNEEMIEIKGKGRKGENKGEFKGKYWRIEDKE